MINFTNDELAVLKCTMKQEELRRVESLEWDEETELDEWKPSARLKLIRSILTKLSDVSEHEACKWC